MKCQLPSLAGISINKGLGLYGQPVGSLFDDLPDDILEQIVNEDVVLSVEQTYAAIKSTKLLLVKCSNNGVLAALEKLIRSNIQRFPSNYPQTPNYVIRRTETTFLLLGHENLMPVYSSIELFLVEQNFTRTAYASTTVPQCKGRERFGGCISINATFRKNMLNAFKRMYVRSNQDEN